MCEDRIWTKTVVIQLAVCVLVAILARVAFFTIQRNTDPLFLHPVMDELTYRDQSRQLADSWFSLSGMVLPFQEPPGYLFAIAGLLLCGLKFKHVILVQLLLGTLSAVLIFLLVKRKTESLNSWWAPLAGILFSLCPAVLYYETKFLRPAWSIFLLLLLLLIMTCRPRWYTLVGAGLVAGTLCLFEAYFLLLVAVITAVGWYRYRWKILFFLAAFAVLILPVTMMNKATSGRAAPVCVNGGINLYIGNNPSWQETYNLLPGWRYRQLQYRYYHIHGGEGSLGNALSDPYFIREVVAYLKSNPLSFLTGLATKLLITFSCREVTRDNYWSYPFPLDWWACFFNGAIVVMGILCLPAMYRKHPVPVCAVLILVLVNTAFFPTTRYRLPIVPLVLVCGLALETMKMSKKRILLAVLAGLLTVGGALTAGRVVDYAAWQALRQLEIGKKLVAEGGIHQAKEILLKAYSIKVMPQTLAFLASHVGDFERDYELSSRYIEEYLRLEPTDPSPYYYLAYYERRCQQPDLEKMYDSYKHYIRYREEGLVKDAYQARMLKEALEYCYDYEERNGLQERVRETEARIERFWRTIELFKRKQAGKD